MADTQPVTVDVEGRLVALSNLDKVLYPGTGTTKAEVMAYYQAIAPVLLPHLADRIVTRIRFPDGVGGIEFFEKNRPAGTPDWVRTQRVAHDDVIDYVLVEDLPTLAWLSNLAALELHVPQWRISDATVVDGAVAIEPEPLVRTVVIDLDQGEGTSIVDGARAAMVCGQLLAADGLVPHAKTSGSKGIQVYAACAPTPAEEALAYVRDLGARAAAAHPDTFVLVQTKAKREGRILIDYLQNKAARTTVAPYSLRGRARPTASTPVTWEEVAAVTSPADLAFTFDEVLARVEAHGDLFADLLEPHQPSLPPVVGTGG